MNWTADLKVSIKEQGWRIAENTPAEQLGCPALPETHQELLPVWRPLERQIDQRNQIECLETDPDTCGAFRPRRSLGKGWTVLNGDALENK